VHQKKKDKLKKEQELAQKRKRREELQNVKRLKLKVIPNKRNLRN